MLFSRGGIECKWCACLCAGAWKDAWGKPELGPLGASKYTGAGADDVLATFCSWGKTIGLYACGSCANAMLWLCAYGDWDDMVGGCRRRANPLVGKA